jgi:hypothetical protein
MPEIRMGNFRNSGILEGQFPTHLWGFYATNSGNDRFANLSFRQRPNLLAKPTRVSSISGISGISLSAGRYESAA